MAERFRVATVTGWPITKSTLNGGPRYQRPKPSTLYYVLDSAYCFRPVGEFNDRGKSAEVKARALADRLNEEHAT